MHKLEQHINFYQDVFRKPEIRFPLLQIAWMLLAVLGVLALLTGLDYLRTQSLRNQLVQLELTHSKLGKAVETLTDQLSKVVTDPALLQQENYLRESLKGKQIFLALLKTQDDTHQVHFSAVLDGLAAMHSDALWLTRIQMQSPGPNLSLTGLTAKAKALPDYLAGLKHQSVFDGMSFRMLNLERQQEQGRYLTFNVSTQHESELQR